MRVRILSSNRSFVHSWITILAIGTADGASAGQPLPTGSGNPIFLKGALADAVFGEALSVGEFTGDADLDAAVLVYRDGAWQPTLLIRPEVFGTAIHAATNSTHFALYRDATDDRDSLVSVGPSGLARIRFDSASGTFAVTSIALTGWAGAKRVSVGQLDGVGGLDLAAVSSTGSILTAYANGSGFSNGPVLTPPAVAFGVDLLDVSGDGDAEISVLMNGSYALYESNFALLSSSAWSGASLRSAVIATPNGPGSVRQSLVLLATLASGNQVLRTVMNTGSTPLTNLGALGAVSMTTGDLDNDGDSDLCFSVKSAPGFVKRMNTAALYANPTFGSPSTTVPFGNPSRNPALNDSGIGLGDFDHDGDLDTLALAQGEFPGIAIYSDFSIVRNSTVPHATLQPTIPDVKYRFFEVFDTSGGPPNGSGNTQPAGLEGIAEVEYALTTPAPLPNAPSGTRRYELSIWHTASLFGPTLGTTTTPFVATTTIAMNPSGTTSWTYVPPQDFLTSGASMTLVVRQIVVDANGVVLTRGPCETVVQSGADDHATVPNLFGAKNAQLVTPEFTNGSHHETADGAVGTVVTGPRVPDFDSENRPSGT